MLAFKLAIVDQCQCILLGVKILLANLPPFSTTSETLSYFEYSLAFYYIEQPIFEFLIHSRVTLQEVNQPNTLPLKVEILTFYCGSQIVG